MSLINAFIIAVALAMDAFAVALAVGVSLKTVHIRQVFRLSWHFGLFQAMMPIIGWFVGRNVHAYIETYGMWIAAAILFCIGGNMIREAFSEDDEEVMERKKDPTRGLKLVFLSTATSIDALAAGFSMSLLNGSIVEPAFIIGVTALVFTIIGIYGGRTLAAVGKAGQAAEILGGVILILLALKTVL